MLAMVALGRQVWAPLSLSALEKEQMGFLLALGSAGLPGEEGALPALQKSSCQASPKGILVRDILESFEPSIRRDRKPYPALQ